MTTHTNRHSTHRRKVTATLLPLTAVGATALCVTLFPHHLPAPQNPQVVDVVFDNRPVIWAARLLLVSIAFVLAVGGAFVVASTVVRMRNGDWLRRAGPFEVSESSVGDLEDDIYLWRSAAYDFHDALERLSDPLNDFSAPNEKEATDDDYDKL
jgi:hypothetical protein